MRNVEMNVEGNNCLSCKHFYITYDQHFPYGCRGAGFKSRFLPSMEMIANSGMECQLFMEKTECKVYRCDGLNIGKKITQ